MGLSSTTSDNTYIEYLWFWIIFTNHAANSISETLAFISKTNDFTVSPTNYFLGDASWF